MDREQALKVAMAISGADSGCIYCASRIAKELNGLLPQFDWFELLHEADPDWDLEGIIEAST